MLINNIQKVSHGKFTRVAAEITFDNNSSKTLFFEVCNLPSRFVSGDASAFVSAMLVSQMSRGAGGKITALGSVSGKLYQGITKAQSVLTEFNPKFGRVEISILKIADQTQGKRVGCFFSGGVDSFYTFLKNKGGGQRKITDLIFIVGFDIPLSESELAASVENQMRRVAKIAGVNLLVVRTNLREISEAHVEWDWQVGAALSSMAILLRPYFKAVYIAGDSKSNEAIPYGTHPLLDPLFSTENMQIIHDGASHNRVNRVIQYVSKSPLALAHLRVCWRNVADNYNCSRCEKCLRTMIALEVAGVLPKAKTFNSSLDLDLVRTIRIPQPGFEIFYEEILKEIAGKKKHQRLAQAVQEMLQRNQQPTLGSKMVSLIGGIDHRFNQDKMFWFLSKKGII